jgi:hypothetical protein
MVIIIAESVNRVNCQILSFARILDDVRHGLLDFLQSHHRILDSVVLLE